VSIFFGALATSRSSVGHALGWRPTYLFDGRLNISPDKGTFQFVLPADRDMANQLARALQSSNRVAQQRAAVESEVHVAAIGHDVAKAVLKRFAGERESNRDCVALGDGLNRVGRLLPTISRTANARFETCGS
jgi:hypothetical protein